MQKFLSFNTVFQGVNIIIHQDDEIIFNKIYDYAKQSEILISSIEEALREVNLTYKDIDIFSSILGPGNFTGIKTGLAVLKMLKICTDKKIITNNLFEIISNGYKSDINILDLGNAKYYIEDKINNKYYTIQKSDLLHLFKENDFSQFQILTNDAELPNAINYLQIQNKVIISEFSDIKWIKTILFKNKNNIFDNLIEPLYIEQANITKRKN